MNERIDWLRQMIRIRRFEEKCAELYSAQKIRGFLHLYIGEEAVATGVISSARPEDRIVATYREHGHALVRGLSARSIMAEMYGKVTGCSRGRGGSMHIFDSAANFYGGNAIVGGGLPMAVGLALADKMQGKKAVTLCFFGEGAMAEGEFHESMNLAELWRLPVLFCCENNRYAMGTALDRSESQTDLTAKALSYKIPSEKVDGMDVDAVTQAAMKHLHAVRETGEPHFLELQTYRFRAHSMFDPELYRDKAEVREWEKRDPVVLFSQKLLQEGLLTDSKIAELERLIAAEIADAVDYAEQSAWEQEEDLLKDVTTPRGGRL
jgi:pyruvate dehydrogenase E1 component alpha subunit